MYIFWELFPDIILICPNLYHDQPGFIKTTTTTTTSTTSTCVYRCRPRSRHAQAQQGAAQAPRPHSCKIWIFEDITIKEKNPLPKCLATKLAFIDFEYKIIYALSVIWSLQFYDLDYEIWEPLFCKYYRTATIAMTMMRVMTDKMMLDDQGVA